MISMVSVWWPSLILSFTMLIIAYVAWRQYKRYEKLGMPERRVRFQRNIVGVFLLLALANIAQALWIGFHQ